MKNFFYLLLLCTLLTNMLHAQAPAQETLNKELYAVMMAYPGKFESIKGTMISSGMYAGNYASTVQLSGTESTQLWMDGEEEVPVLNFNCIIARGLPLEDAKKLYKQWQTLLGSAQLAGAPLKQVSAESDKNIIEMKSIYKWADPKSIAPTYLGFTPRLMMNRYRGETFKVEINIYP